MGCNDDNQNDSQTATDAAVAAKCATDLLPLLNDALALLPGCRSGAAAEWSALGSILGLIIPHLADGFGRATLEQAQHTFSADTNDPALYGSLLERAATTLTCLQKDRVAMSIAPELIRIASPPAEDDAAHDTPFPIAGPPSPRPT